LQNIADHFGFTPLIAATITEAFTGWSKLQTERRPVPLITIWAIWKWHNRILYNSIRDPQSTVLEYILHLYNENG